MRIQTLLYRFTWLLVIWIWFVTLAGTALIVFHVFSVQQAVRVGRFSIAAGLPFYFVLLGLSIAHALGRSKKGKDRIRWITFIVIATPFPYVILLWRSDRIAAHKAANCQSRREDENIW